MMKKQILLSLLPAVLLTACGAQQSSTAAPAQQATADTAVTAAAVPGLDSQAQAILQQTTAAYGFEGVITVMRDGKVIAQQATGMADPQTGAAATIDSLYCVGSVSKQFTAAAVLLLQERGQLDVDDTLGAYFPDCPYGEQVTLRQMLHMRSGIAEFYESIPDAHNINEIPLGTLRGAVTNSGTKDGNRAALEEWLLAQPLNMPPDTDTVYTNSNYFLLARIVEQVSGMAYEDFLRQNIFEPLHMTHTGFIDDGLDNPRLAKNAQEAQTVYVGITMGLGDLVTNAADMQRWMASFSGNTLLSAESIAAMTADAGVGYGFGVVPVGDGSWFHTGVFTSYKAFDFVDAANGYALFAVTNNQAALRSELSDMCFSITEMLR